MPDQNLLEAAHASTIVFPILRTMSRPRNEQISVRAMTFIELLIVIAVIGILVALIFPAPWHRGRPPKIPRAKLEMTNIQTAIKFYTSAYGRWPVSMNVERSGLADFTFGTFETQTSSLITNGGILEANNSEVVSILMDLKAFGNGKFAPNHDGSLNPRRIQCLNAKRVADSKSSGVGVDGVYRDPWGNPYIITVDLNLDGRCRSAFYELASVSASGQTNGLHALGRPGSSTNINSFESADKVMVWSFGPDGKADFHQRADQGVNKDNVLDWR